MAYLRLSDALLAVKKALPAARPAPLTEWEGLARRAAGWRRGAAWLGAVAALSLLGNVLLYARYTPARPLVSVGPRVIRKQEYLADLDAAAGKPVLTRLVYAELIRQAAVKAGLWPTPAQVDARLALSQRQGRPLPPDIAQVREDATLTLALENLRIVGVGASEAEIRDFYAHNAAQFAQPAQVQSILVVTDSVYEAQSAADFLAQGKTADEIADQPGMRVDGQNGFHLDLAALPPALHRRVAETALSQHPGRVDTLPLGQSFLSIKCLRRFPSTLPPLAAVHDQAARLVRLQKAPPPEAELARLYQANRPEFDMDRYAVYFSDVDPSAGDAPRAVRKTARVP